MTTKERLFVAKLLRMAADKFGCHSCNDMPKELCDHFTATEWAELDKKYHQHNEHTNTPKESRHVNANFAWMEYFAYMLEEGSVCKVCNGSGKTVWFCGGYEEECYKCNGSGSVK